uniref:Dehydration up-regulated putative membrane pore protein n=1 Tax=Xerophyta humilis TaxID=211604 RepID=Q2VW44_9LILI|nr:dehydration up-regulated putative membrane pore protein [Xerophyta humilis]
MSSTTSLDTRTFTDEIKGGWDKGWMFDLGHPLLNRVTESFVKAAGIGAIQAVTREGYFITVEGSRSNNDGTPDMTAGKNNRFPNLRGENSSKSLEEMVKATGKEAFQWGLAAGVYSGLTYGLKEARGTHDWKNSAIAGAITGAALALTTEKSNSDHVVQSAVTGAAISTVANLLRGIF